MVFVLMVMNADGMIGRHSDAAGGNHSVRGLALVPAVALAFALPGKWFIIARFAHRD